MSSHRAPRRDKRTLALLEELAQAARVVRRKTDESGLDETNMRLLALAEQHDGIRPAGLTEALRLGPPAISRRVRLLEQAGHVRAEADPRDKRGYRIRCTDDGRALLTSFLAGLTARLARPLDDWDDDDLDTLTRLLHRLNTCLTAEEDRQARRPAPKNWWQQVDS